MSIAVRMWNDEDLEATLTDKWMATLLMNAKTLTHGMARFYPYNQRRTYLCEWLTEEPIKIYATDERMLLQFIDAEYNRRPDLIHQKITQYRPINH